MSDAHTRLLEKLLVLAEEDSENFLAYTRAGFKWRREVLAQLDRIEAEKIPRIGREEDPAVLTRSEFKSLLGKVAPYVIPALLAIAHVLRSIYHF